MKIFLDNGYLNVKAIIDLGLPFNYIVGGRGIGKTFGFLDYMVSNNQKFILMRRTQSQCDLINKEDFSPFKSICVERDIHIGTKPISKYSAGFYHLMQNENGDFVPQGKPFGYSVALSTISNLRGFDASDITKMIYDEFIPERHEKPIREEGKAFLNAYETINRNRELKGEKPVQVFCLANSNELGNAIFMELGLIAKAEQMKRKGQLYTIDREKGYSIFLLNNSPISEAKKQTALYRLTSQGDYDKMALSNNFTDMGESGIRSKPLAEFRSVVGIGEITVYRHKSENTYYISQHRTGTPEIYTVSETDRKRFNIKYAKLYFAYMQNRITFENSTCEILFNKYID